MKRIARVYSSLSTAKKYLKAYSEEVKDDVYIIRGSKEFYYQTRKEMVDHKQDYICGYHKHSGVREEPLDKALKQKGISPTSIKVSQGEITVYTKKGIYKVTIHGEDKD